MGRRGWSSEASVTAKAAISSAVATRCMPGTCVLAHCDTATCQAASGTFSIPARRRIERRIGRARDQRIHSDAVLGRLVADDERLRKAVKSAHHEFDVVIEELLAGEGGVNPRQAKIVSTVAWSTVHGFVKLALEGKFGGAGSEILTRRAARP